MTRALALAVAACLALCTCSGAATNLQDGGVTTTPRSQHVDAGADSAIGGPADAALPDAAPPSGPAPADAALPPGCALPRAARTFIGFSEGMTLDDFELAAYQAERLLDVLEAELCAKAPQLDASGALARALERHELEVSEILFVADDATAADVGLRLRSEAEAPVAYRVRAELQAEGWTLTAATRAR